MDQSAPAGGPNACPFVALEFDRDRRADQPDYRHRCYAEPTPAPRAIAHQEQYCLSPRFAACPIFQDWAARASARPVSGRQIDAEEDAGVAPAVAPAAGISAAAQVPADADDEGQRGSSGPSADDASAEAEIGAGQQLEAPLFAAEQPGAVPGEPAAPAPADSAEPTEPDEPAEPDQPPAGGDEPEVPAFLSGRTPRPSTPVAPVPPTSASPGSGKADQLRRDEVLPSWEVDGRFGAQESLGRDGAGRQLVTVVAVIAILALGVAAVFVIWGWLNPSPGASPSPAFSGPPGASASASLAASIPASVEPSASVQPSTTPPATPVASFRTYRIKPGDTLNKIARHFKVNVADILAANPQITDPNHIEPGQTIIIPVPAPSATP